jgi:murein DD-endopeptidase MepM/ murein hydrolase activator NlpD
MDREDRDVHIILVSDRLTTTRTLVLKGRHVAAVGALLSAAVVGLSLLFSYITVRHAAEMRLPFVQELLQAANAEQTRASREFVRENINAMAVKLGQMQAQLLRMDSLSERVAGLAGVKPSEIKLLSNHHDGQGGPLVNPQSLTAVELDQAVASLSRELEAKSDTLALLENQLVDERIRKSLLPTSLPIDMAWNSSSFGWRLDPISGQAALHEGVDFTADVGTPIRTAAAGVVINVERHPAYGNLLEIDHGNGLVTRYAHCSRINVQPGALVKRGQIVAEVGNTGRTTGPHLHFEVRINGVARNPNHFLQLAQASSRNGRNR